MTPMWRVAGVGMMRAGVWLATAGTLLCVLARAQQPEAPKPNVAPRELPSRFPDKPSIAPSWTIPVESLGFAPPGALYLGERNSLVSLDFIDENDLLFTFRVPALLQRKPGSDGDANEREIRAVVLAVSGGTVLAESNWLLHDRARYLWMLRDGHFLLRDRESLVKGDTSLKLTPLLQFPGPLLSVELDPTQQFLVTNSREPVQVAAKQDSSSPADPPSTGIDNFEAGADAPDLVLRIMHRDSGEVMLVTRVRSMVHVPLNDQGYLDSLRGNGIDWRLDMNFFGGGNRSIGAVKSACMPDVIFVSTSEVLAAACADSGNDALVAMTTGGDKLWIDLVPDRQVWPILRVAPNGSRIARETLWVSHSITSFAPLGNDDIKGQWVQILDAATGKVAFEAPTTPILDAGGNVAISPSGKRVAILKDDVIQVFELPAPPRLHETEPEHH